MSDKSRTSLQAALRGLREAGGDETALRRAAEAAHAAVDLHLKRRVGVTSPTPAELMAEHRNLAAGGERLSGLSDKDLADFNHLLPWAASTLDRNGRLVGEAWASHKRVKPGRIGDRRHVDYHAQWPLTGKHVLEVGCFEGIHTLGLIGLGARVTAVDGRMENVLKTLARLWLYEQTADVRLWDLEEAPPPGLPVVHDVVHHVGVLYHLTDPVGHLHQLLPHTREGVILDTHVARPEEAVESYESTGRRWRCSRYNEHDHAESPFAGLRDHAKWLLEADIIAILSELGFAAHVQERRDERNGLRVIFWARRTI